MSTLDLTIPTLRTLLNGSPAGGERDSIFKSVRLGDLLSQVRDTPFNQPASPVLALNGGYPKAPSPMQANWGDDLPPARTGGMVRVLTPNLWAAGLSCYLLSESPAPIIPNAGATINGADANGNITVTPKLGTLRAGYAFRFMMIALPLVTQTRALFVFEGEVWLILATTTGNINNTEIGSSIIGLLNGTSPAALVAQKYFAFTQGGVGSSVVGQSTGIFYPRAGSYTAGPPIALSPGLAPTSQDGLGILLDQNVQTGSLAYQPAPRIPLDVIHQSGQPR